MQEWCIFHGPFIYIYLLSSWYQKAHSKDLVSTLSLVKHNNYFSWITVHLHSVIFDNFSDL